MFQDNLHVQWWCRCCETKVILATQVIWNIGSEIECEWYVIREDENGRFGVFFNTNNQFSNSLDTKWVSNNSIQF